MKRLREKKAVWSWKEKKEGVDKAGERKHWIEAGWERKDQECCVWGAQGDCWTWAVLRCCAEEVVVLALMSPLRRRAWEQLVLPSDFLVLKGASCAGSALVKAYSRALGSLGKLPLGSGLGKEAEQPGFLFILLKGGSGLFWAEILLAFLFLFFFFSSFVIYF